MSRKPVEAGSLKEGSFIIIDEVPCKIVSIEKSKTGKHGSAKARIVAIGLFDGVKRSIVVPADSKVDVPVVDKRSGQVISVTPTSVQVMDLETYETFELSMPTEEEVKSKLAPGVEVEYWVILNERRIMRVK
ncbi:MAG: translation initiation factor IF-5A [Candidatus Methanomethylicota archaeon]|uniref:Translation initiation factor 5A n=1 Tax=Thermoproteota archaeon TaxID=2056631 RepID=A0A497ESE1_9CREN|nr:MAG: translation initiation factor IF-5A [Candidatus Verstraetearchaeota archaeon]